MRRSFRTGIRSSVLTGSAQNPTSSAQSSQPQSSPFEETAQSTGPAGGVPLRASRKSAECCHSRAKAGLAAASEQCVAPSSDRTCGNVRSGGATSGLPISAPATAPRLSSRLKRQASWKICRNVFPFRATSERRRHPDQDGTASSDVRASTMAGTAEQMRMTMFSNASCVTTSLPSANASLMLIIRSTTDSGRSARCMSARRRSRISISSPTSLDVASSNAAFRPGP